MWVTHHCHYYLVHWSGSITVSVPSMGKLELFNHLLYLQTFHCTQISDWFLNDSLVLQCSHHQVALLVQISLTLSLSPLIPIIHPSWHVFQTTSCIYTELLLVNSCLTANTVKGSIKLVTMVKGDQKVPFSIATTPRCRGGGYSFPRIAPRYPWNIPYITVC